MVWLNLWVRQVRARTINNLKLLGEKIEEVQKQGYAIETEVLTTELDWGRFLSVLLCFALTCPGTYDPSWP